MDEVNGTTIVQNALIDANMARLGVTYSGQFGDLPDPVRFDASDAEIRTWVTEALRAGSVPGISADPNADVGDFVIERFSATEARPFATIQARPKTPFGAA